VAASPSDRGGTLFDQFLRRFFEQPFANRGEKIMALGSGSLSIRKATPSLITTSSPMPTK